MPAKGDQAIYDPAPKVVYDVMDKRKFVLDSWWLSLVMAFEGLYKCHALSILLIV